LEKFIRVAYPHEFTPGSFLGQFADRCRQRHGGGNEILGLTDTRELRLLLDYGNKFHHDTNSAYQTERINGAELTDFTPRTLAFATRPVNRLIERVVVDRYIRLGLDYTSIDDGRLI
jgi:hypothetical protein